MRLVRSLIAGLVASCFVACAAVPDIRFVDPDAEATDASATELPDAAPAADTGAQQGDAVAPSCTTAQPSPDATCCGTLWCFGCDLAACTDCESTGCAAGQVCCVKPGTVQCKTKCP